MEPLSAVVAAWLSADAPGIVIIPRLDAELYRETAIVVVVSLPRSVVGSVAQHQGRAVLSISPVFVAVVISSETVALAGSAVQQRSVAAETTRSRAIVVVV